jgi:hypothetical protein
MPTLQLPLHSYGLRTGQASTARLVNCHPEKLPEDAPWPFRLARADGLASWATVGTGPIEGLYADHGLLYVVSGGGFYSVTSAPAATFRGAVGSSAEIDMDSNTAAVVIVSPPNAFHYTHGTTTFGQITDADFVARGAGDVEFCDNFMLFREPSTGRFFGADLGSVTAFNALSFATAEGSPDVTVGLKVDQRQVLQFGERSLELWANTGIAGFPFERLEPGFVERGCINGKTIAKLDQSVYWVDESFVVRRLEGLTPVRVSEHQIEEWLRGVTLLSLRGYSYSSHGHFFYLLTADEGAWLLDVTSQEWTERSTYGSEPEWNWHSPVAFAGKILVGSKTSNVIAELSLTVYTELSETLRMEATFQPVYVDGQRAFHDKLELLMTVGAGLTTGQGSAPEVMLSWSDDGGATFFNAPNRSLGAIGERNTRVTWSGLGSCSNPHGRVYRVAVSDPVPVSIHGALLEVRGGRL